jgi:hypothetical protein
MLARLASNMLRPPLAPLRNNTLKLAVGGASRSYALSRYPDRDTRFRSIRRPVNNRVSPIPQPSPEVVADNELLLGNNPGAGGLENLLSKDTLVVTRFVFFFWMHHMDAVNIELAG